MSVQVWSGMCAVLEDAVDRYEQQIRLSQKFHAKFLRLSSQAETKLARLVSEVDDAKTYIRDLRTELASKSGTISALHREV
jgi:hypothetical protein